MLGVMLPPLPLTEAIAEGCDADTMTARRLWAAAREAAAVRARRAGEGWPPVGLANHSGLCQALRAIVAHRRLSLRQLVDLDDTAVLTRSMTSYVLRGQRCVTYQVMIAILDVCQVSHEARAAWHAEWWRLAAPEIAARRGARLEGLRARSHRACREPTRPLGTRRCVQSVALPGATRRGPDGILWTAS